MLLPVRAALTLPTPRLMRRDVHGVFCRIRKFAWQTQLGQIEEIYFRALYCIFFARPVLEIALRNLFAQRIKSGDMRCCGLGAI